MVYGHKGKLRMLPIYLFLDVSVTKYKTAKNLISNLVLQPVPLPGNDNSPCFEQLYYYYYIIIDVKKTVQLGAGTSISADGVCPDVMEY